jgi:cell division protein ZapA (FtsZ GTPase activity inhibitor)
MEPGAGDKRPVRVNIFHQTYTIVTSASEAEIQELSQTLDEMMVAIAKTGNMDSTRVAVLAALHLADRLRTLERELSGLRERLDSKTRQFSLLLDQVIETPRE